MLSGSFTEYKPAVGEWERWSETKTGVKKSSTARVWRVLSKKNGTEFFICEGYPGYLSPPQSPRIKLPRFWDIFPLVFNEVEDEKNIFPPSDVWLARHMQFEYNRTREFLREHRQQNRPGYVAPKGSFEGEDLEEAPVSRGVAKSWSLVGIQQGEHIQDKLMAKPVHGDRSPTVRGGVDLFRRACVPPAPSRRIWARPPAPPRRRVRIAQESQQDRHRR